jgi:hypothetical protein
MTTFIGACLFARAGSERLPPQMPVASVNQSCSNINEHVH